MSKLNEIVPPLALCKQIPDGEFADSVLVFACQPGDYDDEEINIFTREMVEHLENRYGGTPYTSYPAPTLQEIGEDLTKLCVTPEIFHSHKNYWTAQGETLDDDEMFKYHHGCSSNPAAAALELWLKLKGVENVKKTCGERKLENPTNGDIIRQMSNEEMWKNFHLFVDCPDCPVADKCNTMADCKKNLLDWLDAPAEKWWEDE